MIYYTHTTNNNKVQFVLEKPEKYLDNLPYPSVQQLFTTGHLQISQRTALKIII
ncbi:MAG TPA: hypothetical protein VK184_25650 [Nostocaceae cyanobacterium]|nr:hypothetical protein [Nostocaceae cyanobacterium]